MSWRPDGNRSAFPATGPIRNGEEDDGPRPAQIVVTFKTLLLTVALFLLTWAMVSIRDTLLIVVVGVFLGLVLVGPVRLIELKTPLGRGMSATVR